MSKMRMTPWIGLAMSASLVTGCVAAPSVLKTSLPRVLGETYADNANPPEFVKAIPVGEEVVVPQGKAAMTLFVVIPQKQETREDKRQVQYVDFSRIAKVEVTITGENLTSPVITTINVSSGSSAAGTVVLNAGRNQIITAIGKDSYGNVVSTVKGVATSMAGQVVNAEAKFGTTPLAEVVGRLNATVAPQVNLSAISGIITPILNPTNSNGTVYYATHPTFVNPNPIVNAINTLIANGTAPSAITTGFITDQLGGSQPIYAASTVTVRLRDPQGNPHYVPSQGVKYTSPIDRNGDGIADASSFSAYSSSGYLHDISLSDPMTANYNTIGNAQSQLSLTNIPPGTYQLTFPSSVPVTSKPWEVLPSRPTATVSVTAGSSQNVDIRVLDVSRPVSISASGSFTSSNYSSNYGNYSYEWYRFPTQANLVYRISYNAPISDGMGGNPRVYIFEENGAQLYQSDSETGTYTFASAATNSLYVYTRYIQTQVDVTTESLGANQSLYNATIHYGQ